MSGTYEARTTMPGGSVRATGATVGGDLRRNAWRAAYSAWPGGVAHGPVDVTLCDDGGRVVYSGRLHPDGTEEPPVPAGVAS